jgi:flagellar assembly protein FliH
VEIAADDRVELGGCLLETPSGTLDSRLEVQLANLRRTLLEARSRQINEDGTL